MGRKLARKWKFIFFYIACFIMTIISACMHLQDKQRMEGRIRHVRTLISGGSFDAALRNAEGILTTYPQTMGGEALYLIGMIYAHPENPNSNRKKALDGFQELISRYPLSEFVHESEIWISMLQALMTADKQMLQLKLKVREKQHELETLQNQINELKEIDLGIEEKKRHHLPR